MGSGCKTPPSPSYENAGSKILRERLLCGGKVKLAYFEDHLKMLPTSAKGNGETKKQKHGNLILIST